MPVLEPSANGVLTKPRACALADGAIAILVLILAGLAASVQANTGRLLADYND